MKLPNLELQRRILEELQEGPHTFEQLRDKLLIYVTDGRAVAGALRSLMSSGTIILADPARVRYGLPPGDDA